MRIGEVALAAGVAVHTLRYYERIGLLPPPERSESGYRDYHPDVVDTVLFIVRAKQYGFALAEVQRLLELRKQPRSSCTEVHQIASARMREIDSQLQELAGARAALEALIDSCEGNKASCEMLRQLQSTESLDADDSDND